MSNTNYGVQGTVTINKDTINIYVDIGRHAEIYNHHREKFDGNLKLLQWILHRLEQRFKVRAVRNNYPVPLVEKMKNLSDYFLNITSYLQACDDQLGDEEAVKIETTALQWITSTVFVSDATFLNDILKVNSKWVHNIVATILGLRLLFEKGAFDKTSAYELIKQCELFLPVENIKPVVLSDDIDAKLK